MVSRVDQYKRQGRYIATKLFKPPVSSVCVDCDEVLKLEMHHEDNDTHNNTPENIVFLCHRCHLRRHRKRGDVGSRSRLTKAQIATIKDKSTNLSQYARTLGMCEAYFHRVRRGARNPIPIDARQPFTVPVGWEYKDRRGKPRALSVAQVQEILTPQPTLGEVRAEEFSKQFKCTTGTIYKARGRYGCYSDKVYDLPL